MAFRADANRAAARLKASLTKGAAFKAGCQKALRKGCRRTRSEELSQRHGYDAWLNAESLVESQLPTAWDQTNCCASAQWSRQRHQTPAMQVRTR